MNTIAISDTAATWLYAAIIFLTVPIAAVAALRRLRNGPKREFVDPKPVIELQKNPGVLNYQAAGQHHPDPPLDWPVKIARVVVVLIVLPGILVWTWFWLRILYVLIMK
jgi:hypothetical protein